MIYLKYMLSIRENVDENLACHIRNPCQVRQRHPDTGWETENRKKTGLWGVFPSFFLKSVTMGISNEISQEK